METIESNTLFKRSRDGTEATWAVLPIAAIMVENYSSY